MEIKFTLSFRLSVSVKTLDTLLRVIQTCVELYMLMS